MLRTASDRFGAAVPYALAAIVATALAGPPTAAAQTAAAEAAPIIVSSRISTSSDAARLELELSDGAMLELALDGGRLRIGGGDAGFAYEPGGELDRAWRELLNSVDGSPAALADRLRAWDAPAGSAGDALDAALDRALGAAPATATATAADADAQAAEEEAAAVRTTAPNVAQDAAPLSDSLDRLQRRLEALQEELEEARGGAAGAGFVDELRREIRADVERDLRREFRADRDRGNAWLSPLRYVWRGIGGILSILAVYGVLVGFGFALVFFGRRYLEGVADTARHYTVRSWLVGIAGSFLLVPAFVLGILGLVISVVGIPLLIAWVPLFPIAAAAAALFGYLAVGHASGEALAERRFYGGEWFKRANSYYYVLTGLGLLLALFFAGYVVEMAGPWFGFVRGLLAFLAVVLTWAALTIGFGAVLLSRFGTRPLVDRPEPARGGMFEEEAHV